MHILGVKLVCMASLFMTCLIAGLLPSRFVQIAAGRRSIKQRKRASQILSFLTCFGGGVFLATFILDLLPAVRDETQHFLKYMNIDTKFPLGEFVIAVGLFFILIVEQIALSCKDIHQPSINVLPDIVEYSEERNPTDLQERSLLDSTEDVQGYHSIFDSDGGSETTSPQNRQLGHYNEVEAGDLSNHAPINNHCKKPARNNYDHLEGSSNSHEHGHSHGHEDFEELHSHSALRSVLLLLALSLHSVFEGLAIGIQSTSELVWTLFTAIIIHKTILAFSLGTNFVKSRMRRGVIFRSLFIFAIMAPIGIGLGLLVLGEVKGWLHSMINGLFQGLATGTFMYITFFEVLPHEINTPNDRLLKVLCIILGFSSITLLLLLEN